MHPTIKRSAKGNLELTLALLKPSTCSYQPDVSAILRHIKANDLNIVRTAKLFWTTEEAVKFYEEHQGRFYFPRLVAGMTR